jgi:hypothetical protein
VAVKEVNDVPARHATIGTYGAMCLTWQRVYGHCASDGKVALTARTAKLADSQFRGKSLVRTPLRSMLGKDAQGARQLAIGSNLEGR